MATPAAAGVRALDLGLLLIRLMLGVVGVFHGSQKLFGAFGGHGMAGFTDFLKSLNVPAPEVSAWLAALAEFVGGLMIALGILPRLGALVFAFNMFVAAFMVHWSNGFSNENKGYEYPLTLGAVLLGLVLTGPGRLAFYDWPRAKRGPA